MRCFLGLGLLLVALTGCVGDDTFQCVSNDQCSPDGTCESNQYCSFPDTTCPSGQRFGEKASTGIAGQCVPVDVGSTGAATSSGSAVTTNDVTTAAESSEGSSTAPGGTTAVGESSGTSFGTTTGFGESSSGGFVDCTEDPTNCDACFDCSIVAGAACAEENINCTLIPGCREVYACLRACAVDGQCNEDCCVGDVTIIEPAFDLLVCQVSDCAPLGVCEGIDPPACG